MGDWVIPGAPQAGVHRPPCDWMPCGPCCSYIVAPPIPIASSVLCTARILVLVPHFYGYIVVRISILLGDSKILILVLLTSPLHGGAGGPSGGDFPNGTVILNFEFGSPCLPLPKVVLDPPNGVPSLFLLVGLILNE